MRARAYSWSRSKRDTLKCEAVFSGASLPEEIYCRIYLPLPLYKGGKRRLFVSAVNIDTNGPVPLPNGTHELFQEKNLTDIVVLKKDSNGIAHLSSRVL